MEYVALRGGGVKCGCVMWNMLCFERRWCEMGTVAM